MYESQTKTKSRIYLGAPKWGAIMSSEPNEVLKRVTNADEQKVEKDRKRKSTEMKKANHSKRKCRNK